MTWSAALGALVVSVLSLGVAALFRVRRLDPEQVRTQRLGRLADETGWSFSPDDVFDYGAMSFALFEWRHGGRAANVLVGETSDHRPVCAFDYRVATPPGEQVPWFTCVITDVGGTWPRLVVQPRDRDQRWPALDVTLMDRLLPVEAHDDFRTWTDDEFFAHTFLDSPLGDWLAEDWPGAQFEIAGGLLLCWFPRRSPRRVHECLRASDALRSRIPGEVWAHYPADRPEPS